MKVPNGCHYLPDGMPAIMASGPRNGNDDPGQYTVYWAKIPGTRVKVEVANARGLLRLRGDLQRFGLGTM
jgi:hypothetical protein